MKHSIKTLFLLLTISISTLSAEKKAIVVGASSGMGREVAKLLSKDGYTVGLASRRLPLLESLQKELDGPSHIQQIDVTHPDAQEHLGELIEKLGGLDLIVISISSYLDNRNSASPDKLDYNPKRQWTENERTLTVDCLGFISMAEVALEYFRQQNHGHLVGISSIFGLLGYYAGCPIYSGAKACISTYMEGTRHAMVRDNHNVFVTDVIPGFVAVEHSPLGEDPDAFWEITVEEAGQTIVHGIKLKRKIVYVPSKVRVFSLLKYLPDFVYDRYFNWI